MFRKLFSSGTLGIVLLACIGFAVGLTISYGWVDQPPELSSAVVPLGSDKENDGLSGPVNRVRTETAKLSIKSGKPVEAGRELLELTSYDHQGARIENSFYLVPSNPQLGKEEYAHDEKGNVSEMTVRDDKNGILRKETYAYEYDAVGNWVKMVTSTVVYQEGKVRPQPTEVTYRVITYYFDQAISEIAGKEPSARAGLSDEQRTEGDLASLRGMFDGWITATNKRDIASLMKFYGSRVEAFYRARNVSQAFVREDRARLFKRADSIEVKADAPEITISSDDRTAVMRFRMAYVMKVNGRDRRGSAHQQLRWKRTGEGWRIVSERDIGVLR